MTVSLLSTNAQAVAASPVQVLGVMGRVNHLRACLELKGYEPLGSKPVIENMENLVEGGTHQRVTYMFHGINHRATGLADLGQRAELSFFAAPGKPFNDKSSVILRRGYADGNYRTIINTDFSRLTKGSPVYWSPETLTHPLFDGSDLKTKARYLGKRLRMAFE